MSQREALPRVYLGMSHHRFNRNYYFSNLKESKSAFAMSDELLSNCDRMSFRERRKIFDNYAPAKKDTVMKVIAFS